MFCTIIDNVRDVNIDKSIRTTKRPFIPCPEKQYQEKIIPGRETYYEDLKCYENINIEVEFNFTSNYHKTLNKLKKKIYNSKTLSFTDIQHGFYKIKKILFSTSERDVVEIGRCIVIFTVDPYFYLNTGIREHAIPQLLINRNEVSYPIYVIDGEGRFRIANNDNSVLVNVSGIVYIDTHPDVQACYTDSGNIFNIEQGEYRNIYLDEGKNEVSITRISGRLERAYLYPNWREI